jgi:hypothetical protein
MSRQQSAITGPEHVQHDQLVPGALGERGSLRLHAQDRRYPGRAHEPLAAVSQGNVNNHHERPMRDEIGASDLRP